MGKNCVFSLHGDQLFQSGLYPHSRVGTNKDSCLRSNIEALWPWPAWLRRWEPRPLHQRTVGSIPGEETWPGCRFNP